MVASFIAEMKQWQAENAGLKRMYADIGMQNELVKEALAKKYGGHLSAERWPNRQSLCAVSALLWRAVHSQSANVVIGMRRCWRMKMKR